jgi:branched-subunit amino acid transport protein
VVTRSFFMLSNKPWPLPRWAQDALKTAPLAALVAVVAPEVFLNQGQFIQQWQDPRWPSALAAMGYFFWRRGILGTIVTGIAVFTVLRLGLGW